MLVKRKVAIEVVVTEEFREQLLGRLRQALQKVESTQQQLDLQGRRYLSEITGKDPAQGDAFRRKLERQIRRQEEIRAGLTKELTAAESLEIGSEYHQGTLDSLIEVRVGDNLDQRVNGAEIVVKDGIVLEIRHD